MSEDLMPFAKRHEDGTLEFDVPQLAEIVGGCRCPDCQQRVMDEMVRALRQMAPGVAIFVKAANKGMPEKVPYNPNKRIQPAPQ